MKFKYLNIERFVHARFFAVEEIRNNENASPLSSAYNDGYKQALNDWCGWKYGGRWVNDLIEEINEIDKEKL